MTDTPPAVPGELIEKAAQALRVALWGPYGKQPPDVAVAEQVLAAVYGDIVEAARRDAVTAAAAALVQSVPYNAELRYDGSEDPVMAAYVDGVRDSHRIVTDLAEHPAAPLSATHADQTPVPRIPRTDGAQERSEGRGDE